MDHINFPEQKREKSQKQHSAKGKFRNVLTLPWFLVNPFRWQYIQYIAIFALHRLSLFESPNVRPIHEMSVHTWNNPMQCFYYHDNPNKNGIEFSGFFGCKNNKYRKKLPANIENLFYLPDGLYLMVNC